MVAGEIGSNFQDPLDLQYYNDMATFFKKEPPADSYQSAPVNNWFWVSQGPVDSTSLLHLQLVF
jgi:hypothetical protein